MSEESFDPDIPPSLPGEGAPLASIDVAVATKKKKKKSKKKKKKNDAESLRKPIFSLSSFLSTSLPHLESVNEGEKVAVASSDRSSLSLSPLSLADADLDTLELERATLEEQTSLVCTTCLIGFSDLEEHRDHYKTTLHQ